MKLAKIFALLLCFALLAGVFSACTKEPVVEPPLPPSVDDEQKPTYGDEEDDGEELAAFRDLTAEQLMSEMGAGWNLGNTLDAGRREKGTPQQQETAWGNPVTTPEMIQLLVDTGFNTLRVPVTWQTFIGSAPDYEIDEAFMNRVQEVVDYGIERDLYVILNLHHEGWHYPSDENYEAAKAQLIAVWAQIAERFEDYSEKLIFEGMNEPRGKELEWQGGTDESRGVINRLNQAFVDTVRASGGNNSKRWLMVTTHAASGDAPALNGFEMPSDPSGFTIVSIHAYTPYSFALNTRSASNEFDPEDVASTRDIDALFVRLNDHFLSKGIPVVMGETGCLNKDNLEARTAWAAYYGAVAASYNVPTVWWDNGIREKHPDRPNEESFGIMDRNNLEWWYPEIAEALVNAFN